MRLEDGSVVLASLEGFSVVFIVLKQVRHAVQVRVDLGDHDHALRWLLRRPHLRDQLAHILLVLFPDPARRRQILGHPLSIFMKFFNHFRWSMIW